MGCGWMLVLMGGYFIDACSDFLLNSTDDVITARTMDFQLDLQTSIETVTVGTTFVEQSGFEWRNRHGFLSFNVRSLPFATDGLNVAGLSAAWLFMTETEYPRVNHYDTRPVVSNLCSYILGNFATVEEVKMGMLDIQVAGVDLSRIELAIQAGMGPLQMLPLHLAIHDSNGKSLTIEFLHGSMLLLDNPQGVLTNEPPLKIHLANVATLDSILIPSGFSSTERFARLIMLNKAINDDNHKMETSLTSDVSARSGVSQALRILNTVIQPFTSPMFATEWIVIRDHQRRHIYVKSTESGTLRRIDMNSINFDDPMDKKSWSISITSCFAEMESQVTIQS